MIPTRHPELLDLSASDLVTAFHSAIQKIVGDRMDALSAEEHAALRTMSEVAADIEAAADAEGWEDADG